MLRFEERIVNGPSRSPRLRLYTPVELETAAEPFRQNDLRAGVGFPPLVTSVGV